MAQIKSLRLSNFKSIGAEAQKIEFAPITLLFGPNSAGKSTVLQALVYAREAILHGNMDPDSTDLGGDWLDLGGFKNIVHGRNPEATVGLGFELRISSSDMPSYVSDHESESLEEHGFYQLEDLFADVETVEVNLQIRWSEERDRPYVESYSCKLDGELVVSTRSSSDGRRVYIEQMPLLSHIFQDPVDFLDDDRSLADILGESLNQSVADRSRMAMRSIMDVERPFKNYSMDELEELVAEADVPDLEVILKLRDELGHRTTRRADILEKRLGDITLGDLPENVVEHLNLKNQFDALPPYKMGLVYEDDTWSQLYEDKEVDASYERAIRLLVKKALDTAICGPLACVASTLENMSYIGPLRDLPPRRIDAPRTKSTSRWAKGLAAWEVLAGLEKDTVEEINFWLGESCLDSGYQVQLEKYKELVSNHELFDILDHSNPDIGRVYDLLHALPEQVRVSLQDSKNGLSVMPQDIGVGISQLFPVVVSSVFFHASLLAIEQPELHVHPRLQTEMADMFIRYALASKNQFLLETHSEHLMLRLLRRVRQSQTSGSISKIDHLQADDLAVHYVEPAHEGTQFMRLRVSDDGDFLDEWPEGFFDERDDELF